MGEAKKAAVKSPKTTSGAIALIVLVVGQVAWAMLDGDPATVPDWEVAFVGVSSAVGLLFARDHDARDHDVSSEQAGL